MSQFTEDNVANELTFKKLFMKLWPFLNRYRKRVLFAVLLVLSYASVGRMLPFLFSLAIDEGITKHDSPFIFKVAVAYFITECLRAGLAFAQVSFIQHFGNRVLFEIREKLIFHVQRLPL